jgi:hypothetical protein
VTNVGNYGKNRAADRCVDVMNATRLQPTSIEELVLITGFDQAVLRGYCYTLEERGVLVRTSKHPSGMGALYHLSKNYGGTA